LTTPYGREETMLSPRYRLLVLALLAWLPGQSRAEEAKVTWYDPTCRFFVAQLPDGFGLYELKSGPEPKVGNVIEGALLGGPEVNANDKTAGEPVALVHWGDAQDAAVLVRHAPGWCKGKRKQN
jgi:hypothetical protein